MENMHDLVTPTSTIKGNSIPLDLSNQTYDSYLAANGITFEDQDENGMSFETRMQNRLITKYGIANASQNMSTITAKRVAILEQINAKNITTVDWETIRTLPGFPSEDLLKKPNPAKIPDLLNEAFSAMKNAGSAYADAAVRLITFGDAGEGRGEKFVEFVFPLPILVVKNHSIFKLVLKNMKSKHIMPIQIPKPLQKVLDWVRKVVYLRLINSPDCSCF